jgi:nucleotide-binding universal stress UspA family protein
MSIDRIVAAVDESEVGRQGIRTALTWGPRLQAEVTLYHVAAPRPAPAFAHPGGLSEIEPAAALDGVGAIESWIAGELGDRPGQPVPALATGYGLPGVEIPRYAERAGAGLLVLGRKPRSHAQRLFEGDTADAVARRSTVPCLFVRGPLGVPARLLVAVDGTDRGLAVLRFALGIATGLSSLLSGVIVEPTHAGEPAELARTVPTARVAALQRRLDGAVQPLVVRRGDPATEILRTAEDSRADVVVIGYRRGGPPGLIEGRSVARRVAHRAACAVLTVPL